MERIRGGLSRGCQQRAGRRRELAQHASPAQDEAQHVLHRAAEAFTPPVTRVAPQEALRALLRSSAVYGDGSSTAPYRDLLALPDSSVRATPVQDLVRCEDSGGVHGEDPFEQ